MRQPEEWRNLWMQIMGDIGSVSPERLEEHMRQATLHLIARIQADGQLDGRIQGLMEAAARILSVDASVADELYTTAFQLKELTGG